MSAPHLFPAPLTRDEEILSEFSITCPINFIDSFVLDALKYALQILGVYFYNANFELLLPIYLLCSPFGGALVAQFPFHGLCVNITV